MGGKGSALIPNGSLLLFSSCARKEKKEKELGRNIGRRDELLAATCWSAFTLVHLQHLPLFSSSCCSPFLFDSIFMSSRGASFVFSPATLIFFYRYHIAGVEEEWVGKRGMTAVCFDSNLDRCRVGSFGGNG